MYPVIQQRHPAKTVHNCRVAATPYPAYKIPHI